MQIREIMTRDIQTVHPNATIEEAASKMRSMDVGPLPVHDGNRVVGMITDRDITIRATAEARDPRVTRVGEIMTPAAYSCFDDQDVRDAARLMADKRVRRLPVLDRNQRLVGIVSLCDLAAHMDGEVTSVVLEDITRPGRSRETAHLPELQQWPPPAWW